MRKQVYLLVLCLFPGLKAKALPDIRVCDNYLEIAADLGCTEKNYLVNFGYKYCRKFIKHNDSFSAEGQSKLENIRNCLIDNLRTNRELTCENSMALGYRSHVPCYTSNGFCEMPFSDKFEIFLITSREFFRQEYQQTMDEIQDYCDLKK
jgi:hypothetical protein